MIRVPGDTPSIQGGIDAAEDGDTVLVEAGVYSERIDFHGKKITVRGSSAVDVILDGGANGPVVTFASGEGRSSVLANLTIQNGRAFDRGTVAAINGSAGGIYIFQASPSLKDLIVQKNLQCGLGVFSGAPRVEGSLIQGNNAPFEFACMIVSAETSPGRGESQGGGGIFLYNKSPDGLYAEIVGNRIEGNSSFLRAGGIFAISAGNLLIANNVVANNQSGDTGAGIMTTDATTPEITQNLVFGNSTDQTVNFGSPLAPGIDIREAFGSSSSIIAENTIYQNKAISQPVFEVRYGSQLYVGFSDAPVIVSNNVFSGSDIYPPIACVPGIKSNELVRARFDHNDVFNPSNPSVAYTSACGSQPGLDGNISSDPQFLSTLPIDQNAFQLAQDSPAVDSGNNAQVYATSDLLGNPRVQDATGLGHAQVDMGAYERAGVVGSIPPQPPPASGPDFTIVADPASLSLQRWHHAEVQIVASATVGTPGNIVLSCANLPSDASCTFRTTSISLGSGATAKTSFSLDTSTLLLFANEKQKPTSGIWFCLLAGGPILWCIRRRIVKIRSLRLVAAYHFVAATLFMLTGLTGCSGKYPDATPVGTYRFQLVATDASLGITRRADITLLVVP
nr:right-handed parallel beta-helix repeat-containing protein [Granulicella aggregans]